MRQAQEVASFTVYVPFYRGIFLWDFAGALVLPQYLSLTELDRSFFALNHPCTPLCYLSNHQRAGSISMWPSRHNVSEWVQSIFHLNSNSQSTCTYTQTQPDEVSVERERKEFGISLVDKKALLQHPSTSASSSPTKFTKSAHSPKNPKEIVFLLGILRGTIRSKVIGSALRDLKNTNVLYRPILIDRRPLEPSFGVRIATEGPGSVPFRTRHWSTRIGTVSISYCFFSVSVS